MTIKEITGIYPKLSNETRQAIKKIVLNENDPEIIKAVEMINTGKYPVKMMVNYINSLEGLQ